ncbi:MAG TPA: 30S ribosomal protein S18 [Patescibacteria group bacterium]
MPKPHQQPRKPRFIVRVPRISPDTVLSYKDVSTLEKFVTPQGYIVGRARTGLTQKQQRRLTQEIKRARQIALLPFTQTL